MPKVSVIIPAYNMARYTVETVENVLNQTFKDYEIIVVDDGSTDNTHDLLQPYIKSHQIIYIYKENGGATTARNAGFKISKGKYIAFLDCDDLWLSKKLEISVDFLDSHSETGLVYNRAINIDKKGNNLQLSKGRCYSGMVFEKLVLHNFIMNSSPIVRRECFKKVGLFDEKIFHPADWDMWLRISECFPVEYIDIPLTKYRVRDLSYFEKNIEQAKSEIFRVLEKAFQRRPELDRNIWPKVASNVYFASAKAYAKRLELKKAKKEILISLRMSPYSYKPYLFALMLFFGKKVIRRLFLLKKPFEKFVGVKNAKRR